MKIVFLSLVILVILVAAFCSTAAAGGYGTPDISVRDLSGKPIGEATVYAIYSERVGSRIPRFRSDSAGKLVLRGLPPGSYEVYAFKESEGYADTFFAFFATYNKKAWQVVQVYGGRTTNVVLELGPKCATLKLVVRNEQGAAVGGTLIFTRPDQPHPYQQGISGDTSVLVPPVAFRFKIEAEGYEVWQSKVLRPRPDET